MGSYFAEAITRVAVESLDQPRYTQVLEVYATSICSLKKILGHKDGDNRRHDWNPDLGRFLRRYSF